MTTRETMLMTTLLSLLSATSALVVPLRVSTPTLVPHRASTPTMNFFNDLQAGMAKLQAGSYDEEEIKARLKNQIRMKPCVMYRFVAPAPLEPTAPRR